MNVIPQYKVIGPYNYDRIIRIVYASVADSTTENGNLLYFIEKINAKRP